MSPENYLWSLSCLPTQTPVFQVDVSPVTVRFLGPVILPVNFLGDGKSSNSCGEWSITPLSNL